MVIGDSVVCFEDFARSKHDNMCWRVAIPSYMRAATLRDKTLGFLHKSGINPSRIDVFVANEEQRKEYGTHALTIGKQYSKDYIFGKWIQVIL